ncbi:hypothetical protein KEM55_007206 [Ascosphaera atra]|nr:hypothetical protein KEM55_007206 [Ascosphaera atra]
MVVNQGGAALKEGGAMPQQQSQKGASSDETNDKKARKLAKTDAKDVPGPGDHRTIGKEQDLFTISEYSPGSPLMLPNGTYILNKLVAFLRAQYVQYGFQEVSTPNIYKKSLWERSGHYQNYSEDMYEVKPGFKNASLDQGEMETKAGEGEPEESYGLKPMNCPGHCVLFKQKMHSFRELPVRYADFSALHRNEVSGSLSGLTRVRRFHQDDAHIFCRPHQIAGEIRTQLQFTDIVMKVFGLTDYRLVLSTRPESGYIGDIDMWNDAERQLTEALNKSGRKWTINEGDGAFYGPKIDLQVKDSDGKLHQLSTIQLDMNLPRRFKLQYRVTYGQPEYNRPFPYEDLQQSRPVMIHRAIFGSLERFFALLIEHYEGRWPFWLNPNPVALMSVNTAPELVDYAKAAAAKISGLPSHRNTRAISPTVPTYRVDVNLMPETLRKKIKVARNKKYNIAIVVGHGELQDNTVNIDYSGQAATKGFKGLDETLKGLRVTMYDTLAKKLTMHVDDVAPTLSYTKTLEARIAELEATLEKLQNPAEQSCQIDRDAKDGKQTSSDEIVQSASTAAASTKAMRHKPAGSKDLARDIEGLRIEDGRISYHGPTSLFQLPSGMTKEQLKEAQSTLGLDGRRERLVNSAWRERAFEQLSTIPEPFQYLLDSHWCWIQPLFNFVYRPAFTQILNQIITHIYDPVRKSSEAEMQKCVREQSQRLRQWWDELQPFLKINAQQLPSYCPPSHIVTLK